VELGIQVNGGVSSPPFLHFVGSQRSRHPPPIKNRTN